MPYGIEYATLQHMTDVELDALLSTDYLNRWYYQETHLSLEDVKRAYECKINSGLFCRQECEFEQYVEQCCVQNEDNTYRYGENADSVLSDWMDTHVEHTGGWEKYFDIEFAAHGSETQKGEWRSKTDFDIIQMYYRCFVNGTVNPQRCAYTCFRDSIFAKQSDGTYEWKSYDPQVVRALWH